MKNNELAKPTGWSRRLICGALLMAASVGAIAATNIADAPIFGGESNVKPNIMVLMDTSNSMSWTHMPDQLELAGAKQRIGYKASICNALYYDPERTYQRPRDANGAYLPMPTFGGAYYDYYVNPGLPTVDLSTSFKAHDENTVSSVLSLPDVAQPAYYYKYRGTPATITSPTHADCVLADANVTNSKWTRVIVSATSGVATRPDERENFAIWYSYHRTRMALSKSALSMAFFPLNAGYRVGFLSVNPTRANAGQVGGAVHPDRYLPISDFDPAQRLSWFSKLTGQQAGGSSPAREGLARVGRHYGGMTNGINAGMPEDPVVNACQPNFTIMTTDGYWNTEAEKSGGGPVQLNGTTLVGQQDSPWTPDTGLVPFGVYDGGINTIGSTRYVTRTESFSKRNCTTPGPAYFTRFTAQTSKRWEQVQTQYPGPGTGVEKRTVTNVQRTWKATKTTSQDQRTTTALQQTTRRYVWYNPATEQTVFVSSCSGLAGCSPQVSTVTVSSCTPQDGLESNGYTTITCNTTVTTVGVPTGSCVPSATVTCNTVTTGPDPATGSECSANGTTVLANYLYRTCTLTDDVTQNVASCPGNNLSTPGSALSCSTQDSGWSLLPSGGVCTETAADTPPFVFTDCRSGVCVPSASNNFCAPVVGNPTPVNSCVPMQPSPENGNIATACTMTETGSPTPVNPATCVPDPIPNAGNNWTATFCEQRQTDPVEAASCTPQPASAANGWIETACTTVNKTGEMLQRRVKLTTKTVYDGGAVVGPTDSWAVGNATTGVDVAGAMCVLPPDTLDVPGSIVTEDDPVVVPGSAAGGSTNSLADVAQYYYKTDLRPGMEDRVRPAGTGWGDDRATWQHMSTFVVGLGVSGNIQYQADYMTATTGPFSQIRNGTRGWPRWPEPSMNYVGNPQLYNDNRSIDDFWHTAVNGRGRYFSANNPETLVSGIRGALDLINASAAVGAGAPVDNPMDPGQAFATSYVSGLWTGDLRSVDPTNFSATWSAKTLLNSQTQAACDDRKIYYRSGTTLAEFSLDTAKCSGGPLSSGLDASLHALFDPANAAVTLSQYGTMTDGTDGSVDQQAQATAASLVNYLRGQRQHEDFSAGESGKLYRKRDAVLGDLINSRPAYVKGALSNYADSGYYSFKATVSGRKGMVYVGGNDGMLHAFYAPKAGDANAADAGKEAWAYVPREVMKNMHKLADADYAKEHRFFVDGSPVVSDVKNSGGQWRTILVGGFRAGGKGYYALDITDPEAPQTLWESGSSCTGCDMGLSFGKPVIGKLKNGNWAVFVTSGHNNTSGNGILYVLDAFSGAPLMPAINTGVGTAANPAGLAGVASYVEFQQINNTVERLYGADLLGNIWRFDVNNVIAPAGVEAARVGVATDRSGTAQPITVPPYLATINRKDYVVVGTGRLLDPTDADSTQMHTIYGIVDPLSPAPVYADLRASLTKFELSASDVSTCVDTDATCNGKHPNGWLLDLASHSKEQVNVDIEINPADGAIIVGTNQPMPDVCSFNGRGRIHFLDLETAVNTDVSLDLVNTYLVGMVLTQKNGETVVRASGGDGRVFEKPLTTRGLAQGSNRMSWRELTGQ